MGDKLLKKLQIMDWIFIFTLLLSMIISFDIISKEIKGSGVYGQGCQTINRD